MQDPVADELGRLKEWIQKIVEIPCPAGPESELAAELETVAALLFDIHSVRLDDLSEAGDESAPAGRL